LAYVYDYINDTLIDDEDKSLGNKFQLNDERLNQSMGTNIMTLNPLFPEKNPADLNSFKPLDVPGMALPAGLTLGGMRLKDIFFSKDKDEGEKKKDADPDDKNILKRPDPLDPKNLEDLASTIEIAEAVERLKKKEMDVTKRDARTKLARDLDLTVTKSGLYEIRKGDYFNKRLQTLKDKGVNFDGYYSTREIANLLGIKTNSGIIDFVNRKNVPTVKKGLYNILTLNDFLTAYSPTKERIENAPPESLANKARGDFLKEVGGSIYNRFKDMRRPQFLPTKVKEIYDKYDLGSIEGGHPFPVEFFVKKFGKNNTLQKDRQIDWIYRNKDKLFDKNDLVFQSTEVNKFYKTKIGELKKLYKELAPLVDQYEGKGPVTNEKDIKTIESLNNKIMDVIAKAEFDAKKFIGESPNSVDLERMSKGGLHGAIFSSETGEVSLYAPGKEAGFVKGSVGEIETEDGVVPGEKLKLAGDYLNIINQVITDAEDKKIFTDYIDKDLLPKFQKGGGVEITPLPRTDFSNGGAAGADENFLKELEFYFTNEDAELPKMQTYKETMNPIEVLNDIIDPRNYPYYADVLARSGVRIAEFAGRILPATGKLIADMVQKGPFRITGGSGNNYVQDYEDVLPSNIRGTGIFSEFLQNITPTSLEKKVGLDKLIKAEEQKQIERGSTAGPKVLADTIGLGAEVTAPIFPGLKLLRAFAKNRNLPVNNVTKKLLIKEVDEVLEQRGMNRRDFLKVTGAGATVILAKLLGFGDEIAKTTKVAEKVAEKATSGGVPPYFFQLVEKIKRNGKQLDAEFDPRVENNMQFEDYVMKENMATGEITIQKTKEDGMSVGDDVIEGVVSDELITYAPGKTVLGKDGKYYRTADEYEESTVKPDSEGKMKDYEEGLDSIEEIIELLPNKLKMSELEAAGYNVDAFPDNIKQLLINDIKKID
tara:strand:- start:70 stop:2871 length:2802 start_codon:yes stop_codon:yes gene_type:complete